MNFKLKLKGHTNLIVGVFLILFIVNGCGGNGNEPGNAAPAGKKGEVFENKFFKATIPQGWTVFDDSKLGMMRIYPEKDTSMYAPTIHLKFEGPISGHFEWAGTPEQAISYMATNYNGSAPEKITINKIEYYKTTYEYGGQKQTMYVAKKEGNKITITLVGKDFEKDPDIPNILETISYK